MAGDWIKIRTNLGTSPKVVRISSALDADRLRVVGALHAVWCLFDAHSEDGTLPGYTLEIVDATIGWAGFGAAMAAVGWIAEDAQGVYMPEFDAHNGKPAKRRATEADRKRRVRNLSASDADKKRTRGEERRDIQTGASAPVSAEPAGGPAAPAADAAGIGWNPSVGWTGIADADREAWAAAYPAVDVEVALRQAHEWLLANPTKARRKAWRRFVTSWMARDQERGGGRSAAQSGAAAWSPPLDYDRVFGGSVPANGAGFPAVPPEGVEVSVEPPRA